MFAGGLWLSIFIVYNISQVSSYETLDLLKALVMRLRNILYSLYLTPPSVILLNFVVLMECGDQSLMSRFNVQGFPTILVFGADKDSPIPYESARTASAIESFALEQLETNVAPPEVSELTGPVGHLLPSITHSVWKLCDNL